MLFNVDWNQETKPISVDTTLGYEVEEVKEETNEEIITNDKLAGKVGESQAVKSIFKIFDKDIPFIVHSKDRTRIEDRIKLVVREVSAQKNRIEKFLQSSRFKLSTFTSDVFGTSGRLVLNHLMIHGTISVDGYSVDVEVKKIQG